MRQSDRMLSNTTPTNLDQDSGYIISHKVSKCKKNEKRYSDFLLKNQEIYRFYQPIINNTLRYIWLLIVPFWTPISTCHKSH